MKIAKVHAEQEMLSNFFMSWNDFAQIFQKGSHNIISNFLFDEVKKLKMIVEDTKKLLFIKRNFY